MHPSQSFRLPSTQSCVFCREGLHSSCVHVGYYGQIGASGLQAELARVPNADGSLVVVPGINPDTADDAMLASLLSLSDVYLTGYHAAHVGQVVPGKTVTVIGDGAVGLSALLASRSLGAERIILMGRHTDRTDLGYEHRFRRMIGDFVRRAVKADRSGTAAGTSTVPAATGSRHT